MAFEYIQLGEVADVTKLAGFEFTKYISYNETGEIIALRALNLRNGELDLTDIKRIDRDVSELLPRSKLFAGDVLLTYTGNGYGDCAFITEDDKYHLAPNICKIAPNSDKVDPYFLFSYIRSKEFYQQMSNHMVGSSQPTIPMKTIRLLEVPLPPMDVQKKVKNIIFALDEKLRTNKAINDNLLEQMQLLYQNLLVCSECHQVRLEDISCKIAMGPFGSNIKVSTFVDEGVPIISGNHLRSVFLEEPSYNYITEEHAQRLKNSMVFPRDIVFTHAGNIGQVAMIPEGCDYLYYMISQRQFYMRCDETKVIPELVLFFFHSREGKGKLLSNANSTGVPSIAQPSTHLKNIEMPMPSKEAQDEWYNMIKSMINQYVTLYQENKRLIALRDSLLPRLMSGEIDVSKVGI